MLPTNDQLPFHSHAQHTCVMQGGPLWFCLEAGKMRRLPGTTPGLPDKHHAKLLWLTGAGGLLSGATLPASNGPLGTHQDADAGFSKSCLFRELFQHAWHQLLSWLT